jgi:hypothetical protein
MATTIITEQPISVEYTATGGQTDFTFPFQIFNGEEDLVVTVDGVVTVNYSIVLIGRRDTWRPGYHHARSRA